MLTSTMVKGAGPPKRSSWSLANLSAPNRPAQTMTVWPAPRRELRSSKKVSWAKVGSTRWSMPAPSSASSRSCVARASTPRPSGSPSGPLCTTTALAAATGRKSLVKVRALVKKDLPTLQGEVAGHRQPAVAGAQNDDGLDPNAFVHAGLPAGLVGFIGTSMSACGLAKCTGGCQRRRQSPNRCH